MYYFALQLFFVASMAFIIYLMARALPRVEEIDNQPSAFNYIEGWLKKLPVDKIDKNLNKNMEKTLRKFRVVILKMDNFIHQHLNKKNHSDSHSDSLDFLERIKDKKD